MLLTLTLTTISFIIFAILTIVFNHYGHEIISYVMLGLSVYFLGFTGYILADFD
jgi:hypothetical protein|tara:strand:+ start:206 stop:367 length:162 start_codon:yes stop_codon:yes gene_type:complete